MFFKKSWKGIKPSFSLTWLYPSTPTRQSKPQKSLTNTKTWKSRLSECGGSKQQQFRWLWEPLAPSRRTWKTEYSQKIPGNINIRELQKITLLSTHHAVIIISDNNLNLGLATTDAASDQGGTWTQDLWITSPAL